jgi:hypothetical protein
MALLYRSVTLTRMWTILEGDAPFVALITQSRRVKGDSSDGWLKRMCLKAPQDFPYVDLGFGQTFSGSGIPIQNFGAERRNFGTDESHKWDETCDADFRVQIIYENAKSAEDDVRDELEMAILDAFRSAGRDLGLEGILGWGPWRGQYTQTLRGNVVRPTTEIVIPVKYQFTNEQI